MKKLLATLLILVACIHVNAQESRQIRISTDRTDLILEVAPDGRLYQSYLGDRLLNEQDLKNLSGSSRGWEVYPGSGGEDYFEPAVAITNNDGNLSTILRYVSSEQKAVEGGTETIIRMKDDQYPVDVTLHMERDQASTKEAGRVMALCFDNALLLKPKILSHRIQQ